jgi:hypothetical protein
VGEVGGACMVCTSGRDLDSRAFGTYREAREGIHLARFLDPSSARRKSPVTSAIRLTFCSEQEMGMSTSLTSPGFLVSALKAKRISCRPRPASFTAARLNPAREGGASGAGIVAVQHLRSTTSD